MKLPCAFRNSSAAVRPSAVSAPVDQLHAKRESPLIDQPARAVERDVIGTAAHRFGQHLRELLDFWRHGEARSVEQALEQLGPPGELVGERRRMGQHLGKQLGKRGPRLQQAEQVHAARQPLDDVAQAIERVIGIGARRNRLQESRQHRLERLLGRQRAKGTRLARPPVGNVPRCLGGIAEAKLLQLLPEDVGIVGKLRPLVGGEAVEDRAGTIDVRP